MGLIVLCAPGLALAAHPLVGDTAEKALLKSLGAEKLIRAREQAERILRKRPGSIIARFGLSQVFFHEEGNLPRALYHIRRTEKTLVARYGDRPRHPSGRGNKPDVAPSPLSPLVGDPAAIRRDGRVAGLAGLVSERLGVT